MSPGLHAVRVLQQEDTASDTELDVVCGNQGALCDVLYDWTDSEGFAEVTTFILAVPVKLILIIAAALFLNRLSRRGIKRFTARLGTATAEHGDSVVGDRSVERAEERATTIGSLLRSFSTAAIFIAALIMSLEVIGISVVPLIASAGVLGLAIGFGAQSVVEDLLRGLFMLAEDQFGVGDRIDVGSVNGTVERVTLRTVVIRDAEGTLWHVPNSEIDRVAHEAQQSSRATIDVGVSYAADLDDAMAVLQRATDEVAEEPDWQKLVTRPPQVAGVQELGDDAVNLRVVVWVDAGERRRFERELRLRLKKALDAAGIEMPNRQVDVWLRENAQAA